MKITTRIFAASAISGMLIGINTGAFACDDCAKQAKATTKTINAKTVAKTNKVVSKTAVGAKIAPKTFQSGVETVSLNVGGTKTKTVAEAEAEMCPMGEKEAAKAKK